MVSEKIYISRQPILDLKNQLHGFEVLLRSDQNAGSNLLCTEQSSVDGIMETLYDFGLEEVVGNRHKIFLKVNSEILMSDWIELFPKAQMVIELLESIEMNQRVLNRCKSLKAMGYTLALSNFIYKPTYQAIFESIDIIKFDLMTVSPEFIEEMLMPLKRWPLTFLAEKVEDMYQFDRTRALGFELFQGYYFERPSIVGGKKIDPSSVSVMKLMYQVSRDAELSEIEETFHASPSLSYHLLRLVNSAALNIRTQIETIRQAIVLLGRAQLNRWAQVLLFTYGDTPGQQNPLLQTAVMRGRFMELLVQKGALGGEKKEVDMAFMTGILSLIDALLLRPMSEVLADLTLADPISEALLERKGDLGRLLMLVEKVEQSDYLAVETLVDQCQLDLSRLFSAEQEAAAWTKKLVEAL